MSPGKNLVLLHLPVNLCAGPVQLLRCLAFVPACTGERGQQFLTFRLNIFLPAADTLEKMFQEILGDDSPGWKVDIGCLDDVP